MRDMHDSGSLGLYEHVTRRAHIGKLCISGQLAATTALLAQDAVQVMLNCLALYVTREGHVHALEQPDLCKRQRLIVGVRGVKVSSTSVLIGGSRLLSLLGFQVRDQGTLGLGRGSGW